MNSKKLLLNLLLDGFFQRTARPLLFSIRDSGDDMIASPVVIYTRPSDIEHLEDNLASQPGSSDKFNPTLAVSSPPAYSIAGTICIEVHATSIGSTRWVPWTYSVVRGRAVRRSHQCHQSLDLAWTAVHIILAVGTAY
jgi:hypothetical protein